MAKNIDGAMVKQDMTRTVLEADPDLEEAEELASSAWRNYRFDKPWNVISQAEQLETVLTSLQKELEEHKDDREALEEYALDKWGALRHYTPALERYDATLEHTEDLLERCKPLFALKSHYDNMESIDTDPESIPTWETQYDTVQATRYEVQQVTEDISHLQNEMERESAESESYEALLDHLNISERMDYIEESIEEIRRYDHNTVKDTAEQINTELGAQYKEMLEGLAADYNTLADQYEESDLDL